jgi:hypothetical protein
VAQAADGVEKAETSSPTKIDELRAAEINEKY